jgi:hypothetical protein
LGGDVEVGSRMPEKMSVWAVLIAMVDRPGVALANVTTYPRWRWVLPVLLMMIALTLSLALTAPMLTVQARQVLAEQMTRLPVEQARMVQTQMAQFQKLEVVVGTALATAMVGQIIGWLILAIAIYFGVLIAGGELEFKRIMAAVPWLSLPFAIELVLQAIFALTQGHLIVNQGLSYLVSVGKPMEDMHNLTYVALWQLTLFRLWHWVLVYALLRKAAKLSGNVAFALTLAYAALGVGARLVLAALAGLLNPR